MHATPGPAGIAALTILENLVVQLIANDCLAPDELSDLLVASARDHKERTLAISPEVVSVVGQFRQAVDPVLS